MKYLGQAHKLVTRMETPVSYFFPLGDHRIELNAHLGSKLTLRKTGKISCIHCGRTTNKSFNQGYCYPCFQKLAQCDSCIMSPERCHYDAGTCREPIWGDHFCMQDHIVYLANSSGLKVGITRASQLPTRWIDQGASQGLAILRTRSRKQAGFCEVMFKQHVADKTNWRSMLKDEQITVDLESERDRLLLECASELKDLQQQFGFQAINVIGGVEPITIAYPIPEPPEKVVSLDLDKLEEITATLVGIKGQYLILDNGVINIRKYTGYELELELH